LDNNAHVCEVPETTDVVVTTPGTTEFDADELAPVPTEFTAVTVNVYLSPFLRPVTIHTYVGALAEQL
jgi:hypothetical protein